jgi:hypothetical protein
VGPPTRVIRAALGPITDCADLVARLDAFADEDDGSPEWQYAVSRSATASRTGRFTINHERAARRVRVKAPSRFELLYAALQAAA